MGLFSTIASALAGPVLGSVFKGSSGAASGASSGGGSWLGNIFRTGVSSAVGGAIDRFGDRKSRNDEFNFYKSKGATLPEIMGSGGVGTGSSGASTVLGNQAAEQARIQRAQDYDREQRQADRLVSMRGQDAALKSSEISAGASMHNAGLAAKTAANRLSLDRDTYRNIRLPQSLNDQATSTPEWKRQQLLATMGVDNALATVIMGREGIDVMNPDTLEDMSKTEFRNLVRTIYGYQSNVFGETAGASTVISEGLDDGKSRVGGLLRGLFGGSENQPTLGN